jgi:hypothetical protein
MKLGSDEKVAQGWLLRANGLYARVIELPDGGRFEETFDPRTGCTRGHLLVGQHRENPAR